MRQFLLGLSFSIIFVVGCAVGSMQQTRVAQAQAEAPVGTIRWEVKCEQNNDKVTGLANAGWEPFAAYVTPSYNSAVCLKRQQP